MTLETRANLKNCEQSFIYSWLKLGSHKNYFLKLTIVLWKPDIGLVNAKRTQFGICTWDVIQGGPGEFTLLAHMILKR
jgi:hypothetical protein